jgi:hypothetical protein
MTFWLHPDDLEPPTPRWRSPAAARAPPARQASRHDRSPAHFFPLSEFSMITAVLRPPVFNRKPLAAIALLALLALGLCVAMPGYALDLVAFTGITGPMVSALTQIAALGPGIKALVGFVGFVVALISLSALRNFGPVLFYVGLAIFAAVGLVIAGAIMGAVI